MNNGRETVCVCACERVREQEGIEICSILNQVTCAHRPSPQSLFEEFKVVSRTGRDYGCGICICHTGQLQPGYFRRARAESTSTHTRYACVWGEGGLLEKRRPSQQLLSGCLVWECKLFQSVPLLSSCRCLALSLFRSLALSSVVSSRLDSVGE